MPTYVTPLAAPDRGICTVEQIEMLLRPSSSKHAGDFRYYDDTQPTYTEVCDYIDYSYDKLLPLFMTYGIVIPMVDGVTKRFCAILNAILTAIDMETGVHSSAPPKVTTKSQKLQIEFDKLMEQFKFVIAFPSTDINNQRPMTSLAAAMWSNMVDLTDTSKYDSTVDKEAFFRFNKEF